MSKMLATLTLAAAMAATTFVPVADARDGYRRGYDRGHHHHRHHGRGYWKDGKWIALGILGAAIAGSHYRDRDCYYRYGRRYCED